ncbi:MAG: hypothetical protein ABL921_27475 [Pirellula sp.]
MIDTKQLIEYAKHPELALQNLSELMDQLESQDETIQNYANEALENCGKPRLEDIPELAQQLNSKRSASIYWSSTLIGRMGAAAVELTDFETIQNGLCQIVGDETLELSARERAAWAITEIGRLNESNRKILRATLPQVPPRLKRFIESALERAA